jgi:hypothetical protein
LVRSGLDWPYSAPHTLSAWAPEQGVDEALQQLAQQVRAGLGQLLLKQASRVDNRGDGHRSVLLRVGCERSLEGSRGGRHCFRSDTLTGGPYTTLPDATLDFGGLAVGDPTVDLVAAWELLDPEARRLLRTEAGIEEPSWRLGRAWALAIAVMTFPYYWHTMPERCATRLALAHQVLSDT